MAENIYIDAHARGRRITALRTKKGLTLRQLADGLGISSSTLSRYESGLVSRIPAPTVEKLALLLGVSVNQLQYGREGLSPSVPVSGEEERDILRNPPPEYLRAFKPSELLRLFRAGELGEQAFRLLVDADTAMPPRILPGDMLTVQPCVDVTPGKVNLLLDAQGRLCLRDAQAYEEHGVYLLRTRDGQTADILFASEEGSYIVIGCCTRLESHTL